LLGIVEDDDPLHLIGDVQLKKRRTLEAIKRILLRESLNQPLMLIFEDLHWTDEQTQELLNLLADTIGTSRILLLVNYRPEYRHDWNRKTYYTQLRLDPLGPVGAEELLTALLGDDDLLAPVRRLVIERTAGNPFFLEEMVQALLEEGVLARNGTIRLVKPLNEVKLPSTVQGVVASRIDRLQPAHKQLLQTISIIGREFPLALVRRIAAKAEDELRQTLAELQLAEFVYEQPAAADFGYIFKHALTHEVAYGSVLIERRRITHEKVGQAIEALYEGRIAEHLSELAYHYCRTTNTAKAVDYLKRAAEQAADRSAVSEAESQLRDALSLLAAMPTTKKRDVSEVELLTALGRLLVNRSFGAAEREQLLRRAYELCERIGNERETLTVLYHLGQCYIERARFSEARKVAEQAVTLADGIEDRILQAGALENLGECCFWDGNPTAARRYFERAFTLCKEISPPALITEYGFDFWTLPAALLGTVELVLGWPERAMQWERHIIERARSTSHPYSQAMAVTLGSFHRSLRRDPGTTSESLIQAHKISDEYGFHECGGWAKQLDGWSHFWRGERTRGMTEMSEAIQDLNASGSFIFSTLRFNLLAEMRLESGDIQAAETLMEEALKTLKSTKEGWYEPEAYRVAAKVMAKKPDSDPVAAETYLRRAIEIARRQDAKWWELRATVSLAHLLCETNRRDEGRQMLAEIYGWFTEGFDTADLKDAKALLDELSR
jgi:tetratricopeptide (TPR) repeat protein